MAKYKIWIQAKKVEAYRVKNLVSQSRSFLTSKAGKVFTKLRQVFVEAPILNHFDLERYIRIEMDISRYAIGEILGQLTSDNSDQWHLVAYYSRKMIFVKTWYKTHDRKLLAIVEVFKTWRYYLESCKHEVLVLTDDNNLPRFMNTKILSSR